MVALIFPGQGSQKKGMGQEFFAKYPELVKKSDEVLGYSIEQLCIEDPLERLSQTQFTQPALYIVNALTYLAWKDENSKTPAYVAGHSLGEYNALFSAGVFDYETGLKLVIKRGELMSRVQGGAMAAIVGLSEQQINEILEKNNLVHVAIANKNSHTQFVLSGPESELIKAKELCASRGAIMAIKLNVSGAFHSKHMSPVQKEFTEFLNNFKFNSPLIPIIANCTAELYQETSWEIKKNLCNQIINPVLWTNSIDYLLQQDVRNFKELGPGRVLTGLVNRIKNGQ